MKNTASARTEYETQVLLETFDENIILKRIGLCWCAVVPARGLLYTRRKLVIAWRGKTSACVLIHMVILSVASLLHSVCFCIHIKAVMWSDMQKERNVTGDSNLQHRNT
jgi:hypothetical protein